MSRTSLRLWTYLFAIILGSSAQCALAYDCSETTSLAVPDSFNIAVGDHIKYVGDPNACSLAELPEGLGCIFPDCQRFSFCSNCDTCSIPYYVFGADSNFWLNNGLVGSTWEVVGVSEWTGDTSWDCVELCRCD